MKTLPKLLAVTLTLLAVAGPLAAADLKDDLLAREKALWTAWGEKKGATFRAEAVEDYTQAVAGVGMTAGREAVAKAIEGHNCVMKTFAFSNATLRQPAPTVAVLNYVATQETTCGGTPLPAKVFVTSVWVQKGGKWLGYSYQETPID